MLITDEKANVLPHYPVAAYPEELTPALDSTNGYNSPQEYAEAFNSKHQNRLYNYIGSIAAGYALAKIANIDGGKGALIGAAAAIAYPKVKEYFSQQSSVSPKPSIRKIAELKEAHQDIQNRIHPKTPIVQENKQQYMTWAKEYKPSLRDRLRYQRERLSRATLFAGAAAVMTSSFDTITIDKANLATTVGVSAATFIKVFRNN